MSNIELTIACGRYDRTQALALIAANKIHDGKTLIGLMLYNAARQAGRL